jgi:hypothetical protein
MAISVPALIRVTTNLTYHQTLRDNSGHGIPCAVEHLARIFSLSNWKHVQMVMLTTALDCSQDKARQFFIMGGFASSAERWTEFDAEWRKRLALDGLAYFHMYSFTQCIHRAVGPFDETWIGKENEGRRRNLLADLLGIVQAHAWQKFAAILPVDSFAKFSDESHNNFMPTLIATAGRFIWADVEVWRKRERFQKPSRMVFEDGDTDKGTLIDAIKELSGRTPSFESKKDIPEKGIEAFTPLQGADILTYEAQKLTQKFHRSMEGIALRFPYHQLEQIPGGIRILRAENVPPLDEMLKVFRFFDANPLGKKTVQ